MKWLRAAARNCPPPPLHETILAVPATGLLALGPHAVWLNQDGYITEFRFDPGEISVIEEERVVANFLMGALPGRGFVRR